MVGYQENDADARVVCELAENLRDAILEYQVSTDLKRLRSLMGYMLKRYPVCPTEIIVRAKL